jgi:hypothetical protein
MLFTVMFVSAPGHWYDHSAYLGADRPSYFLLVELSFLAPVYL